MPDPAKTQTVKRRRGRLLLVGSALAAVMVVTAAVWGPEIVQARRPLPTRVAGSWLYALSLDPPAGWVLQSHGVVRDLEGLTYQSFRGAECTVTAALASLPAELRVQTPPSSEPVRVNGRAAAFSSAYRSPDNSGDNAGVRMAYGDGGVLDVVCDSGFAGLSDAEVRATVFDFAERLRFSTGDPLLLPMSFDRLPSDLKITTVQYQRGGYEVILTSRGQTVFPPQAMGISVQPRKPDVEWKQTTVDGQPAEVWQIYDNVTLCRPVQSQFVCVQLSQNPSASDPAAAKQALALVTETMRTVQPAADVSDRATWFDAQETLPS
jgi:hypothetical protein